MAEILIKNMEMPKECITGTNFSYEYCPLFGKCHGKKPKDEGCILVEVPTPHGRLADVDKMFSMLERSCGTDSLADTIARDILKGLIKNAPTVIEASE